MQALIAWGCFPSPNASEKFLLATCPGPGWSSWMDQSSILLCALASIPLIKPSIWLQVWITEGRLCWIHFSVWRKIQEAEGTFVSSTSSFIPAAGRGLIVSWCWTWWQWFNILGAGRLSWNHTVLVAGEQPFTWKFAILGPNPAGDQCLVYFNEPAHN